jgi:cation diffusion facilitator CzcD-associated flavoprotein CzcO
MRFNTTVEAAGWDEDAKVWHIALAGGDRITARILIAATGFLSQPRLPEIPGIADFAGKIVHTADWDDTYDASGRRIAVVGTGATAVQLVPELAKVAADQQPDFRFPESVKRLFRRVSADATDSSRHHRRNIRILRVHGSASTTAALPSAEYQRNGPLQDAAVRPDPR